MPMSRRRFIASAAATPLLAGSANGIAAAVTAVDDGRFDPWLEVDSEALGFNVAQVSRLAGGRPILAVIKNNAYGLGLTTAAPILERFEQVAGFAVVKADEAIALREAGIGKPILLLSLFSAADGPELAARNIQFSLCTPDSPERVAAAAKMSGTKARAQIYIDTGMSRMGIPYHRALPVIEKIAGFDIDVRGIFTGFTEEPEFDREQLSRLLALTDAAKAAGASLGRLHAASSHAVFNFAEAHLDQVRPGIALFGAYPGNFEMERTIAELRPAVSLKARVVRVERLRAGDSVSYGRNYVADRQVWVATIPAGHTDGVPRSAVDGAHVLIGGRAYPVVGAVSASHTIVELGEEPRVAVGDVATLLGAAHADIHPNRIAAATSTSVYDRLMHLNPLLPRVVV